MRKTAKGIGFGRICLLGDHCDWAQRQVIASSMDRKIVTTASRTEDAKIRIQISNSLYGTIDETEFDLERARELPIIDSSLKYVNAVVAAMLERNLSLGGTDLEIRSNVPMKKGLSSSAALCVSTTRAFNELYSLGLSTDDVIQISYRAENGILGIGCGMMDQTASAHEHPLFLDFHDGFRYEKITIKRSLPLVIIDVGGERDTKLILNTLNHHYFEERDPLIVKTLGTDIPDLVHRARAEMEGRCRLERIGDLMNQNQLCYDEGLEPFCPRELGNPSFYKALNAARGAGALGAKWTGAGGLGSIIALAGDAESSRNLVSSLKPKFSAMLTSVG